MSEDEGFSNLLQVLNSWKDSEGVMVFVHWSSGDGDVTIGLRAYVFDCTEREVHSAPERIKEM